MTAKNIDFSKVTPDQIGRCTKIFEGSKPCYMVLSESDDLTEYKVRAQYNTELKKWIFTCTCPSGAEGFANVQHKSGVCKHVRWSLAAAAEEKAAMAEQVALNAEQEAAKQRAKLQICGRPATQEEWDRVMNAKPVIDRKAKAPQPKPFSLMK